MCGLFGFSNYSGKKVVNLATLTKALSEQAAERGIDATGIAFNNSNRLIIVKEPKSAYKMDFKHPDDIVALIGHTRHATQGKESKNYNNHPFYGRGQGCPFALAHNGVIINDDTLRRDLQLQQTKIETDSYIAVQLIEQKRKLNFESLKYMAESVDGSFSFSVLDAKNNLYLVKGDSPLSILHFTKLKMYVYASTDEILYRALIDSPLFEDLKNGDYERVNIDEGEILKIRPDGMLERDVFVFDCYRGRNWWNYGIPFSTPYGVNINTSANEDAKKSYVESLKSMATYWGYSPSIIDDLLSEGFSLDEIEEYLYEYEAYAIQ